jgi:hypothetical protein
MEKVKGMLGIKCSCGCCSPKVGEKKDSCCQTNESKSDSCSCGNKHENTEAKDAEIGEE